MASEYVLQEDKKEANGHNLEESGPPGGQEDTPMLPSGKTKAGEVRNGSPRRSKVNRHTTSMHPNGHHSSAVSRGISCSSIDGSAAQLGTLSQDANAIADGGRLEVSDGEAADGRLLSPRAFFRELGQLARLAWPVVITQILHYTIGTVAIIFAGHRGKTELDVVALSTSMLSATAIAVANGLSGYCDTIFAQVYGSTDRKKLGVVLQKCLVIITLGIFPSLALHINLQPLLLLMGHDHVIARLSEQYLIIHTPGTIAFFIYIVFSKYVQNQNKEKPILVVAFLANVLNVVLHALFFVWLKTDVWGSAVSQCISYISLMLFTITYIKFSGLYKETWQGWTSECFLEWAVYGKLGFYSLLQHCIEIWAFDMGIILSGLVSLQMMAAQSIAYQYVLILYTIAWGIGLAGGIRVGQHLGANDPLSARLSSIVSLIVAGSSGVFFFILVISLRFKLPLIFTDDNEIVGLVASVLPFIAAEEVFDFLGGTMNGILRGCGRQSVGTAITVPTFSFVLFCGIPLMLKTSLNIKGFWIAVLVALFFQSAIGTLFLLRLNWKKEADKAQSRVKASGGELSDEGEKEYLNNGKGECHDKLELDILKEKSLKVGPENMNQKNDFDTDDVQITKSVICLRVLAFSLSIGCLVAGLIIRCTIHIPQYAHPEIDISLFYANATIAATYEIH